MPPPNEKLPGDVEAAEAAVVAGPRIGQVAGLSGDGVSGGGGGGVAIAKHAKAKATGTPAEAAVVAVAAKAIMPKNKK